MSEARGLGLLEMTSKNIELVLSFTFAAIVGVILLCVLIRIGDLTAWTSTALGLAAGWGAGILAAPYQSEQRRFARIGNVAAGFVSGYGISKVDRMFDLWLDPSRGPLILEPTFAQRTLLFLTSFLLATIVTYVGRKYVSHGRGSEQPPSAVVGK